MKKKLTWKTAAGLILAAGAWRRLSEDLPIHGDILAPPEPPFKPECKDGERLSWDPSVKRWICIPKAPSCPSGQYPKWDTGAKRWVCVPKL